MKDERSYESCRIVKVSPSPPSSTSWCATSPRSRTECTGTPSTLAPRAPVPDLVVYLQAPRHGVLCPVWRHARAA